MAYTGTIDDDPDHDYEAELREWRLVDHADDEASSIAVEDARPVACCLIGFDLGAAFIYEVATHPVRSRLGLARELIVRSVDVLAHRGTDALWAWVTDGNTASERLLGGLGFLPVTPPVDAHAARLLYRAADALGQVDDAEIVAAGVRNNTDGPELVLFGGTTETTIESHGATVRVRSVAIQDPNAHDIARECMPVRGISFLLDARRGGTQS